MSRQPVGTKAQSESRTALYAQIAATLEDVPGARYDEFFEFLGLLVRRNAAEKAASPHRWISPWKGRRGRKGSTRAPKKTAALRPWLLVDERALNFERALLHFNGAGRARPELLQVLSATSGIRQVIETGHKRDVFAIALFRGIAEREQLRARLEETCQPFSWDDIVLETHLPAIQTWKDIALESARQEKLVESPTDG
jgi:hypothetical protein